MKNFISEYNKYNRKTMNHRVLSSTSWLIGCHIIQSILSLIISMISARYLGPTDFGLISYATSLTSFVIPIAKLGLNNTLVQELKNAPDQQGLVLGSALGISTLSSLLSIVGLLCFVCQSNPGETDTIVVCFLYSISLLFEVTQMLQYWFQERLQSKYIAISTLCSRIIIACYRIYLIISGSSIYWFATVNALDYFLASVMLYRFYKKLGGQPLRASWKKACQLVGKSRYYILSSMMVVLFGQTDKIMIKNMLGNAESGFYSVAITCAGMSGFVFVALIDSMRPVILEHKKTNQTEYENSLIVLFSIVIYLALAQSVFFTLAAKFVVGILYGESYAPAAEILQIITWYSSFSYMGVVRNIWILGENRQSALWKINLLGAVLNICGNLVMIPRMGATGAALVSVLTQVFTNMFLCFWLKNIRPCGALIRKAWNPVVFIRSLEKCHLSGNKTDEGDYNNG